MLSRRSLLTSTLGAGLALGSPHRAAAQTPAAQGARKRMIVDAQVHLWKAETPDWPWVPGMKPQMPEPFTIEKLVPLMDEAGVDRAVIVPPSWPGDRNDYGLEAAKRYPDRFRVMGRIPLKDPQSAALLPKWKEQPGMLGVRVTFLGGAGGWLTDGTADWFWPAAEKAGLPVMFLTGGRSSEFARIAERHPQLTLIADHMGVVGDVVKSGKLSDAIEQTASLAKYPNVSVKLSAAPTIRPKPIRSPISPRTSAGCSTPTDRSAAIGEPTSPTASPRRRTASALPTSPSSWRSCRRTTRTGSWDARSRRGWGGASVVSLTSVSFTSFRDAHRSRACPRSALVCPSRLKPTWSGRGPGIHNHGPGLWIPGSRAQARAPE
jgi:predicted TIM-barrel fold metal-dependent hydrolase